MQAREEIFYGSFFLCFIFVFSSFFFLFFILFTDELMEPEKGQILQIIPSISKLLSHDDEEYLLYNYHLPSLKRRREGERTNPFLQSLSLSHNSELEDVSEAISLLKTEDFSCHDEIPEEVVEAAQKYGGSFGGLSPLSQRLAFPLSPSNRRVSSVFGATDGELPPIDEEKRPPSVFMKAGPVAGAGLPGLH